MAQMTPQKHNISEFNNGNEYGTQGVVAEDFTNLVENTTYANETIESLDGGTYSSLISYKFPSIVNDSNGASYMAIYKVNGEYQSFSNITPPNATYWKSLGSTSPEYTMAVASTTTGYAKSYELLKDNVATGVKIDIPKDMVISSAEIKTVTQNDVPYQGAVVGDKYIDFTIANATSDHLYLPVNDLVDVYTAGNGLNLTNGEFSVKVYGSSGNGLSVSSNGLQLALATTISAGAMSSSDKTNLDSNTSARHTHSNKELLDTYTQTETNIASAVTEKHSHSNKSLLDTYDQTNANITDAVSKKHTHSNKTILDNTTASFTTAEQSKLLGIQSGAEVNVQSDWSVTDTSADSYIKNKPNIPSGVTLYTTTGQNTDGAMTQKATTDILNTKLGNQTLLWSGSATSGTITLNDRIDNYSQLIVVGLQKSGWSRQISTIIPIIKGVTTSSSIYLGANGTSTQYEMVVEMGTSTAAINNRANAVLTRVWGVK